MTTELNPTIRILLLEDEPFIRDTIKRLLRAFDNIELREVGDGAEGLALMGDGFRPDVVLCDVMMEPVDGMVFLETVCRSQDPARATTPIIMLTAARDKDTVLRSEAKGAFAFLAKPVSLALLTERVNAALRKSGGGKVLRKHATRIGTANAAAVGPGQKALLRLIYFSRFGSAMPKDSSDQSDEIARIGAAAGRNNAALDVTGLLVVRDGHFIQALEGPSASVRTTYNRILLDPRHQGITIIDMGPATDRKFRSWEMSAPQLDNADIAIFETLDYNGAFDPAGLTASSSLHLLTTIETIRERRLREAAPVAT
jgi:two-component system chemotaxis response regulator CheY